MKSECSPHGRILLLVFFILSIIPLIGCNDNSKATGTMVEVSEETKAYRKSKIDAYKGGPPKSKGKVPGGKTK
jgi:hypothetical protein